jgi:hypothetical protein
MRTPTRAKATLVTATGIVAFNVIIGVFGENLAIAGLAIFIATVLFVVLRSKRLEGHGNA